MSRTRRNGHAPPEKRTPEGRFAPGASGNPGGRPKGIRELREALEAGGAPEKMAKVILDGLTHEDIRVRLEAFDRAADRLYGRPGTLDVPLQSVLRHDEQPSASQVEEAQRVLTPEDG